MVFADLILWWYSGGFKFFIEKLFDKLKDTADFFSISNLLKTLFSPFRQISAAGTSSLALDVRLRAWFDRQFSRFFGAFIRLFIIFFGLIALILELIFDLVFILLWPLRPLAPIACVVLFLNGVLI